MQPGWHALHHLSLLHPDPTPPRHPTTATLACLAWQRSGRPSYTAWRDWVQTAIRLDVFLSPPRLRLMLHSVDVPPPALPGPQLLSAPAAALVLLSNTLVVHLLLLPVAHTLPLWPHAAVQLACVARVVYDVRALCDTRMFSAPISRAIMEEIYRTLRLLLGLLSLAPAASSSARPDPACHCQRVVSLLQLLLGVGLSVALRATWDARAYQTFRAQRPQRALPTAAAKKGLGVAYDRAYDALSQRLLLPAAAFCRKPSLWVLAAVAVWDVCGVVLWRA